MIATFFRYLYRDLRRQPLRTVLTLSGVVWGTFAIVLLLAFGQGIQKQNMKNFRGMGHGIVLAFPGTTTIDQPGVPKGRAIQLTPEQIEALKRDMPGIRRISPEFTRSKHIRYGREELFNTVRGVNVEFGEMRNVIAAKGRFLDPADLELKRRVAFIGSTLAEKLFLKEDPVGKRMLIEGVPFLVIGVMVPKEQNSNYNGQRDKHCAFIPWTTYAALYGERYVETFILQPDQPGRSARLIEDLRRHLGEKMHFAPQDKDALQTWDFAEFEQKFTTFFLAFNIFFGIIGAFTLMVGGVGVASIMMVVVEERTREIGIKLAVGAKRKTILRQFFAEAICIVLFGGFIGIVLSALVLKVAPVDKIRDAIGTPQMNLPVALVTVLVLILIGTVSGLTPARRAASTDPIVALRK